VDTKTKNHPTPEFEKAYEILFTQFLRSFELLTWKDMPRSDNFYIEKHAEDLLACLEMKDPKFRFKVFFLATIGFKELFTPPPYSGGTTH